MRSGPSHHRGIALDGIYIVMVEMLVADGHHVHLVGGQVADQLGHVVTRIARSEGVEQALELASVDDEVFIGGGAQVYRVALERALVDRIYLTRIHAEVEGDTFLPEIDLGRWKLVSEEHHEADEKNEFPYSFLVYERTGRVTGEE